MDLKHQGKNSQFAMSISYVLAFFNLPCYNLLMEKTNLPGVYPARRKDSTEYFRASITYKNKHISLGSYADAETASRAYSEADVLLKSPDCSIDSYDSTVNILPFEKWVVLCNFKDNGVYIGNPIYLRPRLVYYYFAPHDFFIFSSEDLFYYSAHKIQRRGGHYFVSDYGSQVSLPSRYGIKSHAVKGRDYIFINGNSQDWQYSNIKVVNSFHGVTMNMDKAGTTYSARIHVNGYLKIGTYGSAAEAAIAYNKAADILKNAGISRQYAINYIDGLSAKAYADIYSKVPISKTIIAMSNQ